MTPALLLLGEFSVPFLSWFVLLLFLFLKALFAIRALSGGSMSRSPGGNSARGT